MLRQQLSEIIKTVKISVFPKGIKSANRENQLMTFEKRCTAPNFYRLTVCLTSCPQEFLSLVFICRENPRRSGILLFPDRPRCGQLIKTQNRRYPSSGMNGDKSGESGVFLFSRRIPDFCCAWRSFPTNENSKL